MEKSLIIKSSFKSVSKTKGALTAPLDISSKQSSRRAKNEFYRYYAGYSLEFARWALVKMNIAPGGVVLDPWNGSGTTAAACVDLGFSFQGYDINPVMVHLGRARVASTVDFEEAFEIINTVAYLLSSESEIDIRTLGNAFREVSISNISARSAAISALFPLARQALRAQKTKNPSWYKKNSSFDGIFFQKNALLEEWRSFLHDLTLWRPQNADDSGVHLLVESGDSRKLPEHKQKFDGILTSPPYLTRLDYVQATLPEYILLKYLEDIQEILRLRQSMLGSPVTSRRTDDSINGLPNTITALLNKIKSHHSKASSSYYFRFFSTYFVDLQISVQNISDILKSGAQSCMVVQSSHYKEIEIDLPAALTSIAADFGLQHFSSVEFDSRRSISIVNSRAHKNARKPKSEIAIFFRKD